MRKFLQHIFIVLMTGATVLVEHADAAQARVIAADTSRVVKSAGAGDAGLLASASEARTQRSFFSPFRNLFPFRTNNVVNDKLLSNVKVFPNPIVDQISLSFRLDKQSSVSVKVMDALGNEVMT